MNVVRMHAFRPLLVALALTASVSSGAAVAQQKNAQPAPQASAPAPNPDAGTFAHDEAKESAAQLAAAGWLVLLDRKDWGTAWEGSAALFRKTVPLATWMDNVPGVRKPWGEFLERTPVETVYRTRLPGRPPGEYVTAVFKSKFEKREVQEVVTTVLEPDGKWRVTGYSPR